MTRDRKSKCHWGAWLKRRIEDLGISQVEFSVRADIPLPTLARWLSRPAPKPHGYQLSKLAKALNLPREEIDTKLSEAKGATEPASAA